MIVLKVIEPMASRDPYLQIVEGIQIPLSEVAFTYVRSSGPGGQNVNKVNSQVQLSWKVHESQALPDDVRERLVAAQQGRISKAGNLRIHGDRYRDREKNREDCLNRLREMVTEVLRPPKKRKKTRIPRGIVENRLKNKQKRAEVKQTRRRPRLDD